MNNKRYDEDFTEDDLIRIKEIEIWTESGTKGFKIPARHNSSEYEIKLDPTTQRLYGGFYQCKAEACKILDTAYCNTSSEMEFLVNLYAMQGYTAEDVKEDIKENTLDVCINGISGMELQDRIADKMSAEEQA